MKVYWYTSKNFRRYVVSNIKKKTLEMQRVLQLVLKFSSSKMLQWNPLNSKFLKSLRMLWFCLGKKSQEDGSYNIMSVLPLVLARPHQEPQPCRDQQQRKKSHFEHFKTQEYTQLDTGKEHTIFFVYPLQIHTFLSMSLFSHCTLKQRSHVAITSL